MNLGRCLPRQTLVETVIRRFGGDFFAIPLVVAMGVLQPTGVEMSVAMTLATVLRSPEARGCRGRCLRRRGVLAGCSR